MCAHRWFSVCISPCSLPTSPNASILTKRQLLTHSSAFLLGDLVGPLFLLLVGLEGLKEHSSVEEAVWGRIIGLAELLEGTSFRGKQDSSFLRQ